MNSREKAENENGAGPRAVAAGAAGAHWTSMAPSATTSTAATITAGTDQRENTLRVRSVAVVEQHDRVHHEHHHRADIDQDLEQRDDVHLEAGEDRGQADHVRDERERCAHRLPQDHHQQREAIAMPPKTAMRKSPIIAPRRAAALADRACADQ